MKDWKEKETECPLGRPNTYLENVTCNLDCDLADSCEIKHPQLKKKEMKKKEERLEKSFLADQINDLKKKLGEEIIETENSIKVLLYELMKKTKIKIVDVIFDDQADKSFINGKTALEDLQIKIRYKL